MIATATGVSWGIGQLINDLVDVEADRIDAPHRPGVHGLLPEGPTVGIAILLALLVAAAVGSAQPSALLLLILSALLMLAYQPAKRIVGMGNLAHGALMGSVAALGFVSAVPSARLSESLVNAGGVVLVTGLSAATYLQANYEKDASGDRVAGYHTLAHALGLRGSAVVRIVSGAAAFVLARRFGLLDSHLALGLFAGALILLSISALWVVARGTAQAALGGYRFAVHAATLALGALAAPFLGSMGTVVILGVGIALVERAFYRHENP